MSQGQPEADVVSTDCDPVARILYQETEKSLEGIFASLLPSAVSGRLEQVAERWWCLHQVTPRFGRYPAVIKGDQIVKPAERRLCSGDCTESRTHEIGLIAVTRAGGCRGACDASRHADGQ